VAKEADVARAMAECVRRHGPIHVLVVNHGIWPAEDVLVKDLSLERWNHTIAVNLTGSFLLIREFLRQVERHRLNDNVAIVMVGSTAGKFGEAFHAGMCRFPRYASSTFHPHRVRAFVCVCYADYAVTKSAMMHGLLLSLKNEIIKTAPKGRINVVAPGWVRTPMGEPALKDLNLLYQALASSPLKKVSEPEDIANGTCAP